MRKNISWNTKKVANGFQYKVYEIVPLKEADENGKFAKTVVLRTGIKSTRARAKSSAQKLLKYFR